jgi:hypothetical protein
VLRLGCFLTITQDLNRAPLLVLIKPTEGSSAKVNKI